MGTGKRDHCWGDQARCASPEADVPLLGSSGVSGKEASLDITLQSTIRYMSYFLRHQCGPAKSSLPTYIFVGFSTFPRKRMDSVFLSESSIRKGWLKEMTEEGLSFERTISLVVVAAAASVPSSLTSSTAL